MPFTTRPLDLSTWSDFAKLAEDHNGVWAGCWCLNFHQEGRAGVYTAEQRRAPKQARVRDGRAHAALVFDDARASAGASSARPRNSRGLPPGSARVARLADHLLLRRTHASPSRRCRYRARWRARRDRSARRWQRGELSRGHQRPQGLRLVSPQRHGSDVRAPRVHAQPPDRQASVGGQPVSSPEPQPSAEPSARPARLRLRFLFRRRSGGSRRGTARAPRLR